MAQLEWKNLLGSTWPFYGATENQFKLGRHVWRTVEDEVDGYRSCLETVEEVLSNAIFFKRSIARVVVRASTEIDGWDLVDVSDGHVWLTFGTDNSDSYYPSFVFRYQPKLERKKEWA